MKFEKIDIKENRFGVIIGSIFGYFLFTTILYYVLKWLDKIPENWSYYHIMGISILIVLVGILTKRLLE